MKAIITGGIYLFELFAPILSDVHQLREYQDQSRWVEIEVIRIVRYLLTSADIGRFFKNVYTWTGNLPKMFVPDVVLYPLSTLWELYLAYFCGADNGICELIQCVFVQNSLKIWTWNLTWY